MPYSLAIQVIDESSKLGAKWISFTGGEPFLAFDELLELIKHSSKTRLLKEVVTGCSWANNMDEAVYSLRCLRDAGLNALNISVDDFHQTHIPLSNVQNCFDTAKKLGLNIVLMITVARGSKINSKTIKGILGDQSIQVIGKPQVRSPSALAIESAFTPIGRGSEISTNMLVYNKVSTYGGCNEILTDIGIKPNGDVLPCCSALSLVDDAVLGNIKDESLSKILDRAWRDERFTRIRLNGFRHSSKHVNRCHQCYDLF
jgi:radical SAM protein with 4Fe4S-binding SPASM domain